MYFAQCSLAAARVAQNGNRLTNIDDAWDTGWHDGFVWGIAVYGNGRDKVWCTGDRPFGALQVSAIVSKYIQGHPEQWSANAELLVTRALAQAFPCKK